MYSLILFLINIPTPASVLSCPLLDQLGKSVYSRCFAISICSTAGEIFELGDTDHEYCLQSCSKPLNYCLARMLNDGGNDVHKLTFVYVVSE